MVRLSDTHRRRGAMLQSERVARAIEAVKDCCGHCAVCSSDCPVFVARRALEGLAYDLQKYEEEQTRAKK